MKLSKLLALFVLAMIIAPAIIANAQSHETYTYGGVAYLSKNYMYIGKVPEKITIKTNTRWDKSIFFKAHLKIGPFYLPGGKIYPEKITVKIYRYMPAFKAYLLIKQKTYENSYYETDVFNMKFSTYSKYWYAPWIRYLKFDITLPKDKDIMFRWTGKYKIYVTGVYKGGYYNEKTKQFVDLTIYVEGKTKPFEVKASTYTSILSYWGNNPAVISSLGNTSDIPPNVVVYAIDEENETLLYRPMTMEATDSNEQNSKIALLLLTLIVGIIAVAYIFKKET
ncbi:MAG TPA: hypothetical protein ENG48_06795 [Candidatus Atribacteria bacterium]|nr:hypothetical protein [Candidatus Atribacteria bacterium]